MRIRLLATGLLLACCPQIWAQTTGRMHMLPLFMSSANNEQQGFTRIINHSNRAGEVRIYGIDDSGEQRGPVVLSIEALRTMHFNSQDLENGNATKSLSGGLGPGQGDWRLLLYSDLDIEPLGYVRTPREGFLTAMHDRVSEVANWHHVPTFNPASNINQHSRLRLINPTDSSVAVTITGRDDAGMAPPGGAVHLSLPAKAARSITAEELEAGGLGLEGHFGDGAGKWQLFVSADAAIEVMSLIDTPTEHISNISSVNPGYRGAANLWQLSFEDGDGDGDYGYLILMPDSRLYGWLPGEERDLVAAGHYNSEFNAISSTGLAYESGALELRGLAVSGGSEGFQLTAAYRSGDWIQGQYTVAGVSRSFRGSAFTGFDRGADVSALKGVWRDAADSAFNLLFDMTSGGGFSGDVTVGNFNCGFEGAFEAANLTFKLYESKLRIDCAFIRVEADVVLGIRDLPAAPGGGDLAVALIIATDEEVAFGTTASR